MRSEFAAIGLAFDMVPQISTTGLFSTVFNQVGNFTYTLPGASGTLASAADIAAEATTRASADSAEVTARNAAVAAETTRALAAEATNTTAALAAAGIGRNRIHNGGFGINQRAQVSGGALAAGAYGHDRWKAGAGGCTYTFAQTQPSTVITITAGTLQQVIEALTVEGGSYTLSWLGTATARINAGSYLASPVTVTGLAANTAITVEFNTGTADRAQLEPGSVASVFARRSYRYELAECQRFYCVGQVFTYGYGITNTNVGQTITFPVQMRAAPTVVAMNSNTNITFALMTALVSASGGAATGTVTVTGNWILNVTFIASADL